MFSKIINTILSNASNLFCGSSLSSSNLHGYVLFKSSSENKATERVDAGTLDWEKQTIFLVLLEMKHHFTKWDRINYNLKRIKDIIDIMRLILIILDISAT